MSFFACSVGVCIASGLGAVLIIKKSAREFAIPPVPPRTPIDAFDRKLLLRVVRKAKIRIATMAVLLVLGMGLPEIRNVPVWAASGLRSESTDNRDIGTDRGKSAKDSTLKTRGRRNVSLTEGNGKRPVAEIRRFSEPPFPSQTSVPAITDTQSAMRDNGDGLSTGARYGKPIQGWDLGTKSLLL